MSAFDKLSKDNEFILHFNKCWPKLRLALIERQMELPIEVSSTEVADIGRRTVWMHNLILDFQKIATPEIDPLLAPKRKPLHRQHLNQPTS
jgi:hypothetical protein